MGSLRLFILTIILCVGIVTNVSARVQTRGQRAQNIANVEEPSKGDDDTFETLTKLKGSSDSKKRTLLGENLMKVTDEDNEDLSEEGSGELINEKEKDDEYYLDDEDYEDDEDYDDDEDIYDDDEDEDYSGDDAYDDEDDYDDEEEDYEEEEDYINKGSKKATVVKDLKKTMDKKDDKSNTPKPASIPSTDDDLHFADDEETGKDLNLSDDEYKVKNPTKNGEILYEYYNEFFEEDDDDYEEEDFNAQVEDKHQITNKPTRPSIKKETVPSRTIPSYFGNLSTSHLLLMGASALISFILFTIAFVVCCHQKQQKKKYGNMPFVIDSNLLSKSSQKSHHPSNFVNNSSTSIVKNYQRVPTSTREFLSNDSTSTSCSSGLENPNHLPELMDVGSGETKKPLLP